MMCIFRKTTLFEMQSRIVASILHDAVQQRHF